MEHDPTDKLSLHRDESVNNEFGERPDAALAQPVGTGEGAGLNAQ